MTPAGPRSYNIRCRLDPSTTSWVLASLAREHRDSPHADGALWRAMLESHGVSAGCLDELCTVSPRLTPESGFHAFHVRLTRLQALALAPFGIYPRGKVLA